jgi:hypothetical protein
VSLLRPRHGSPLACLLARSRDGGEAWTIENPSEKGALIPVGKALHGMTPPGLMEKPWQACPGGIDFTHPDFTLAVRMTDTQTGPSRFYYSMDGGKTWDGPFGLPLFGQKGIAARMADEHGNRRLSSVTTAVGVTSDTHARSNGRMASWSRSIATTTPRRAIVTSP